MIKVGVLTHPITNNYGGILQAICLCSYLESIGCEVWLIQKEFARSGIKKFIVPLFENMPLQNFKGFRERHLVKKTNALFSSKFIRRKTDICVSTYHLKRVVESIGFDAVIVGSDQVWRMDYIDDGFYDAFFLSFLDSSRVKKIAYAASFGKDVWDRPDQSGSISDYLKDFDAVSLRERQGIEICRENFSYSDTQHVIDPTLLVKKEFYDCMIGSEFTGDKNSLVTYLLDSNLSNLAENVRDALQLNTVVHLKAGKKGFVSIDSWVTSIKHAECVITDSFHGMVFSIIYNKPFVVVANEKRGLSRFTSLLAALHLEDHLVTSLDPANIKKVLSLDIDYHRVNEKISELRDASEDFIKKSLSRK